MKKLVSILVVFGLLLGVVAIAEEDVVTITIPPSEDGGFTPGEPSEWDDKVLSYETKEDGTIVITMTQEVHAELMADLIPQFRSSLDETVAGCEAIKSIEPNEDYTQMDILIDTSAPDALFFSFQLITCVYAAGYYQIFNGASPDDVYYVFNFFDEATGNTNSFDSRTDDLSTLFPSIEG